MHAIPRSLDPALIADPAGLTARLARHRALRRFRFMTTYLLRTASTLIRTPLLPFAASVPRQSPLPCVVQWRHCSLVLLALAGGGLHWAPHHVVTAKAPAIVFRPSQRLVAIRDTTLPSPQVGAPVRLINPANFDTTVSPCQDFDAYVNGGWLKRQGQAVQIPASTQPLLDEVVRMGVTAPVRVIEDAWHAAAATSDSATRVLGNFYGSCMIDTTGTATGSPGDPARVAYCLTTTEDMLGLTVSEVYAKRVLSPTVRAQMATITARLKQAFAQRISAASWLSTQTKQQELTKLPAHTFNLMYGDPSVSWPAYGSLALSPTDFKKNQATVANTQPQGMDIFSGLLLPLYVPFAASTGANAALLTAPFFDSTDVALTYGALGFILGHELSHNFDHPNKQIGKIPKDTTWWTSSERRTFQEREQRLLVPYLFAGVDRIYHEQNPAEHVADVTGLRIAYAAFERTMQGRQRLRIGGLTPEQRFFVAFASGLSYVYAFMSQDSTDFQRLGINTDAKRLHALALLRTNLAVSTFPMFAKAFGCKTGDAMVWSPVRPVDLY